MKSDEVRYRERLIAAALRYVAVADWFERRPIRKNAVGEAEAMDTFARAEANLRRMAEPLLRKHGARATILLSAGAGNVEPSAAEVTG